MQCRWCNGDGGEVDAVLDFGQGPWYECNGCLGTGHVSLWSWLKQVYWTARERWRR